MAQSGASRGWALVTGASGGIGLELARLIASEGWDVVLTARTEEALEALALEIRRDEARRVLVLPGDLARPGEVDRLLARLQEEEVEVDLLVNNAGFGDYGPVASGEMERFRDMIQVNVTALTELCRGVLPGMVERGRGGILNVASTAAFQPGPLMAVYYATKAYVLSFSEALRNELRGSGVTVTTLCPGPTRSGFQAEAGIEASPLVRWLPLPSSRKVAEHGVRALLRGKGTAVHGWLNRLQVASLRRMPRKLVPGLVRRAQEIRT